MTHNQGYTVKQHAVPVKRYCQTLNLKNNLNSLLNTVRFTAGKRLGRK